MKKICFIILQIVICCENHAQKTSRYYKNIDVFSLEFVSPTTDTTYPYIEVLIDNDSIKSFEFHIDSTGLTVRSYYVYRIDSWYIKDMSRNNDWTETFRTKDAIYYLSYLAETDEYYYSIRSRERWVKKIKIDSITYRYLAASKDKNMKEDMKNYRYADYIISENVLQHNLYTYVNGEQVEYSKYCFESTGCPIEWYFIIGKLYFSKFTCE